MISAPRLTIGLPVYNGEEYLEESLDAMLGQSYENYELIISDNASTDGTAEICRRYAQLDSRIRYVRQPHNIGGGPNHMILVELCRTELFKWMSADDLYARDLLERCVAVLDAHPEIVLAHSWTAAIDGAGRVTQALPYPLSTDSTSAPERFRSLLFGVDGHDDWDDDYGAIRADDFYGVIRTEVLRRVRPHDSYYYADRTYMAEIALHGPFLQIPEWLYFRRDHPDRAQHACPTVRSRCVNMDPRRTNPVVHPAARLLVEYVLGYAGAVRRAPLSEADKRECRRYLRRWLRTHSVPAVWTMLGHGRRESAAHPVPPGLSLDSVATGRERDAS